METQQPARISTISTAVPAAAASSAGAPACEPFVRAPRLHDLAPKACRRGRPPELPAGGAEEEEGTSGGRRLGESPALLPHRSRTPAIFFAILSCLFAIVLISPAADPADELVQMCHNGVTITVQRRFVPRRQALGDTLGPCDCCNGRTGIVFERETYNVTPGQPFTAKVAICPAPAAGLFSFGAEVMLSQNVTGTGLSSTVPVPLNFHTVRGPGADLTARALTVAAKGSIDFFQEPQAPYRDQAIGYVQVPALPPGTYLLTVQPRNDLGATEQIFIDGNGQVLDAALTYRPAQIVVAAAPAPIAQTFPTAASSFLAKLTVSATDDTGGVLALEFVTEPGRQYFIQYSSDLLAWTTVLPAIPGTGSARHWLDPGPPDTYPPPAEVPARFYRLLRLQP